ncbi:MAG: PRC-barrel domain-containing protein [Clostridia bacterium]|nr:PRC-barrel domain-containing protein [Clostridia bacterium]
MTDMKRLIGLPVIMDGRQVGTVERGVLHPDGKALRGLMIREGMRTARWIDAGSISLLGQLSILCSTPPVKPPRDSAFRLFRVTDANGLRIGLVTDALLDEETLRVTALEISSGPVDDLIDGRFFATSFDVKSCGATGHVTIPCKESGKEARS